MILKYEQGGWLPIFPCCFLWSKQMPQAAGKESNGLSSLVNLLLFFLAWNTYFIRIFKKKKGRTPNEYRAFISQMLIKY